MGNAREKRMLGDGQAMTDFFEIRIQFLENVDFKLEGGRTKV